jgi:hypothetical protein
MEQQQMEVYLFNKQTKIRRKRRNNLRNQQEQWCMCKHRDNN